VQDGKDLSIFEYSLSGAFSAKMTMWRMVTDW